MPSGALLVEEDGLEIAVVSPEEIRERARLPQSSGLSSSLAKSLPRAASLPSDASTPTSARSETRCFFPETLESRLLVRECIPEEQPEGSAEEREVEAGLSANSRPILRKPRRQHNGLAGPDAGESPEDDFFVPPHMMSLPACTSKAEEHLRPGSLFEGVGRKLRGMDAVRFRRSVMQQTGFLEPAAEHAVH